MRKLAALLLALLMLIPAWPALGAGIPTAVTLGEEFDYETAVSLSWVGDRLYILGGKGLYAWQAGLEAPERVLDLSASAAWMYTEEEPANPEDAAAWRQAVRLLASDGEALYALQPASGQVFCLEGSALTPAFQLDDAALTAPEGFRREVLSACWADGRFFLLLGTDDWSDYAKTTIAAFEPATGVAAFLPTEGAQALAAGASGQLLAVLRREDGYVLARVDAATGAADVLLDGVAGTLGGLGCLNGQAAFLLGSQVKLLDSQGAAQTKGYLPVLYQSPDAPAGVSAQGLYAYADGRCVYLRDLTLPGEPQVTVLTLAGNISPDLLRAYALARPDVAIQALDPSASADLAMLLQSRQIDLAVVSAPGSFAEMRRKGYAADLSASPALVEAAAGLYPAVREVLCDGDRLLGFPLSIQPDSWTLDETRWQALGLPEPPATWEALFDQVALWLEEYARDNPDLTLWDYQSWPVADIAAMLTRSYILQAEQPGEAVNFDTTAYRALMQLLMDSAPLFSDEYEQWGEPLLATYYQGFGITHNDSNRMRMVLAPAMGEGEQVLGAQLDVLAVSAASAHQEEARDFVAFAAGQLQDSTRYALYPDLNEPVRFAAYEHRLSQLQAEIDALQARLAAAEPADKPDLEAALAAKQASYAYVEANEWSISPEAIAIYRAAAQHLRIPDDSVYLADDAGGFSALSEIIAQFWDGGMTTDRLDSFIIEMNRVARMVFLEAQ